MGTPLPSCPCQRLVRTEGKVMRDAASGQVGVSVSQVEAEPEGSGVDHDNGAPSLPDQLLHTRPEVETDGPGPNLGTQDQEVWW